MNRADFAPVAASFRRLAYLTGFLAAFWLLSTSALAAEHALPANPHVVMAAFLRNFAHYIKWPTNDFPEPETPWRIGVLGNDPFRETLEKTFAGRAEQGRSFEIVRGNTLAEVGRCQILFISEKDASKRLAALAALKNQPVLTVSDSPRFLQEGGIIQFRIRERIEMSVNLDQARIAGLNIPSKVLEVSSEVVEDGKTRRPK